jgi:hypothetical protein
MGFMPSQEKQPSTASQNLPHEVMYDIPPLACICNSYAIYNAGQKEAWLFTKNLATRKASGLRAACTTAHSSEKGPKGMRRQWLSHSTLALRMCKNSSGYNLAATPYDMLSLGAQ